MNPLLSKELQKEVASNPDYSGAVLFSHYNDVLGIPMLSPGASPYERFHEEAHMEQHKSGSLVWRAYKIGRLIPFVNYAVTLWIERDAMNRAKTVMERLGVWDAAAAAEAESDYQSYVRMSPVPK